MSKMKKFILATIFVTLVLILSMSTKVSAKTTQKINYGGTINLSLTDMENSNNVYCVAHSKSFTRYDKLSFKAIAYVDITGKHAEGKTSSGKQLSKDSDKNAVLAAILGGALSPRGYGTQGNYTPSQQALYSYWNDWVRDVGSKYGFQKDSRDSKVDADNYINTAKAAAKRTDYKIRIYLLHSNSSTNPQELVLVDVKEPDTPEPKPGQTTVKGYINISGYVWEDIANSKSNTINSKYEEGDIRLEGIIVHWKANDGSEIASTKTGKDGSYELKTDIDLYNHPYGIKDKTKYDKINNSYIEFEYNGLKYTTVKYNGTLSNDNTSKGKENEQKRTILDEKFDKIENKAVYDGDKAIISELPNTKITDSNYASEFAVSASTQGITTKILTDTEKNKWIETKKFCADHCEEKDGHHVVYQETHGSSYLKIYCDQQVEMNDPSGYWADGNNKPSIKKIIGDAINTSKGSECHYYSADEKDGPINRDCRKSVDGIYVWNIKNMNLGLVRREQPDAAITSDIEKVRVIMKGQEYTYKYGNRGIQDNEELFDYKVKFGNKYTQTYSRPVNPSDIAYVNYNNTDDLRVYVTYNIILKNQSNTLPMTINSIVNYYDSNYTIYTGQGTATSSGWQEASGDNNGYKIAYNTNKVELQPESKSEIIKIEFEVNQDRIKGLLNDDATLFNVSEIFSYTTHYGKDTICAERETAEVKGKVGKQYAGLDIDSTPGNATPGNVDTYEDDTDRAPSFLLKKDPNYKTLSGIVYEDTQTQESQKDKERLGNGQKEENEKGVENVKVELIDPNTGETAYLYYKDTSAEKGANKKPAITYTDSNGNYTFGEAGTCGVVVDDYIIKYTYGNADEDRKTTIDGGKTFINARNYKSTIITEDNVKSVMQGKDSNTWHLYMNENVDTSVATDDLKERLEIGTLKYDNYNNGINMSAYSKEFNVKVEYTQSQEAQVDENGGDFQSDWGVFDFGIIERAREDLKIEKTISKIKLTLANGQILLEGDPRKDKMNYVKAIGFKTNTDENGREIAEFSTLDKMLTIELDSELTQGAKLEVWYSITATNDSEKDYDYEKDYTDIINSKKEENQKLNFITTDSQANYYYYGDKNGLNIITRSVETVVDYLNSRLNCKVGSDYEGDPEGVNNGDWFRQKQEDNETQIINADYLKDNGYISYKENDTDGDMTYETIKNRELQTIETNTFADLGPGETKTSTIYASTTLANQEDNSIYDNHVEIIGINSKIARTIKKVEDNTRAQEDKEYQPGNYIPALGSEHQQDDDRVRIIVTPPTGIKTYTAIYIISAVVGLIVIAGGIVLIKKKTMKK